MIDILKEYILMCEKAERVQNYFRFNILKSNQYYRWYDKRYNEIRQSVVETQEEINTFKEFETEFIFLFTQDQLQTMVITSEGCLTTWLESFLRFAQKKLNWDSSIKDVSMEQLWLAFVMYEKYKKTWNGKDWIKEKEK